jgi:hypothetical protein
MGVSNIVPAGSKTGEITNPDLMRGTMQASAETVTSMRGAGCQEQHTWDAEAKRAILAAMQPPGSSLRQQRGQRGRLSISAAAGIPVAAGSSGMLEIATRDSSCMAAMMGVQGGSAALSEAAAVFNLSALPTSCPLFARKISGEGAAQWAEVMLPALGL